MVGYPDFLAIGTPSYADRVYADIYPGNYVACLGIDDIDSISRSISNKHKIVVNGDRGGMGANKAWVADSSRFKLS